MKYATLRLSKENDSTDYFDLKYKIIDNSFTRKWRLQGGRSAKKKEQ